MRFKYLGEQSSFVQSNGNCTSITVPSSSGKVTYYPVSPATEFVVNSDIGYEVTDTLSVEALQVDPRFEQL
jgi:hypothetical protein